MTGPDDELDGLRRKVTAVLTADPRLMMIDMSLDCPAFVQRPELQWFTPGPHYPDPPSASRRDKNGD